MALNQLGKVLLGAALIDLSETLCIAFEYKDSNTQIVKIQFKYGGPLVCFERPTQEAKALGKYIESVYNADSNADVIDLSCYD